MQEALSIEPSSPALLLCLGTDLSARRPVSSRDRRAVESDRKQSRPLHRAAAPGASPHALRGAGGSIDGLAPHAGRPRGRHRAAASAIGPRLCRLRRFRARRSDLSNVAGARGDGVRHGIQPGDGRRRSRASGGGVGAPGTWIAATRAGTPDAAQPPLVRADCETRAFQGIAARDMAGGNDGASERRSVANGHADRRPDFATRANRRCERRGSRRPWKPAASPQ